MNFRELECFLAVVDHGGITRAASALYLAQPSLSQIIRRLEADLGVELFRRVGRGLVLAPAGEALVGPARQVVRDMLHARQVAEGYLGLEGGRLDLAISTSLTSNFLAAWVGLFRRMHPAITVRLTQHEGEVDELVTLIRSGACELAFSVTPTTRQGVVCTNLGAGEVVLALPPGWKNDLPDPVPLAMINDIPFILDRGFGRDFVAKTQESGDFEPTVVVDVSESSALVPLLMSGAGAAFLPMRQGLEAHRRGATIRMTDPPATRSIYSLTPSGPLSSPAQAFLELSVRQLDRWREAVDARMTTGMSLLEAAVSADEAIEAAYDRLNSRSSAPEA